jgi:hypothetical protein
MAIQFIQVHEVLIKVTPLISQLLVFMMLQKGVTVLSSSSFNDSAIACLVVFVRVASKKAKVHFCTQKV